VSSLKDLTKRALRTAARRLPARARRAALASLAGIDEGFELVDAHDRYALLQRLAREHGIDRFVAHGDVGWMQGHIDDGVVFRFYAAHGVWASTSNALFTEQLKDGGSYLDIGANIGLTTVPIATANPAVRCVAFEPDPQTYAMLVANLAANCPDANVRAERLALSATNGRMTFERSAKNWGDHRLRLTERDGRYDEAARDVIEVDARRLDDIDLELPAPLAVKIDTQGAEPLILAGGSRTLGGAHLIALEFWPYGMARANGSEQGVIDFVRSNFREGMLCRRDQPAEWLPIDEVATRLRAFVDTTGDELDHLDLFARK